MQHYDLNQERVQWSWCILPSPSRFIGHSLTFAVLRHIKLNGVEATMGKWCILYVYFAAGYPLISFDGYKASPYLNAVSRTFVKSHITKIAQKIYSFIPYIFFFFRLSPFFFSHLYFPFLIFGSRLSFPFAKLNSPCFQAYLVRTIRHSEHLCANYGKKLPDYVILKWIQIDCSSDITKRCATCKDDVIILLCIWLKYEN